MGSAASERPVFRAPPVVETLLGVQFAPLYRFQSHHYGWFWREYLSGGDWAPSGDQPPLPTYTEVFGAARLKLTDPREDSSRGGLVVRQKLKNASKSRTLQLQPDKLYYSWRNDGQMSCPSFDELVAEFTHILNRFKVFLTEERVGDVHPNLWEVQYINAIPSGGLWQTPEDWHRVLPFFFPAIPVERPWGSHRFATYDGNWHFEIPGKQGRVHARVAKMVVNQQDDSPVLFYQLTARGEIGGMNGVSGWEEGVAVGRKSCVDLFVSTTSEEAHNVWKQGGQGHE